MKKAVVVIALLSQALGLTYANVSGRFKVDVTSGSETLTPLSWVR
jgi:hypothetical protein